MLNPNCSEPILRICSIEKLTEKDLKKIFTTIKKFAKSIDLSVGNMELQEEYQREDLNSYEIRDIMKKELEKLNLNLDMEAYTG